MQAKIFSRHYGNVDLLATHSDISVSSAQARRGWFATKNVRNHHNHHNRLINNHQLGSHQSPSVNRQLEMDLEKVYNAMEKGHKICKLLLLKKWDPSYKKLSLNRDTQQIVLSKLDAFSANARSLSVTKTLHTLDIRLVKEVHSLDYKLNTIRIADRWRKDKDIQRFNPEMILVISYSSSFVINHWILLFESKESCRMWTDGINNLRRDIADASHYLFVERWLRKQFHAIMNPETSTITIKHMKPFVQTKLQCKVQSKQLQEITEGEMGFEAFVAAHNRLLNFAAIFAAKFDDFADPERNVVTLANFIRFLNQMQCDDMGKNPESVSNFLRHYLRDVDMSRDVIEPHLTRDEFVDFLFSKENMLFNPVNQEVVQDMTRPLTHYWIASSHNTYLTGDQLKSESSLEAYSRALTMGCRCIELDCWDGQRKATGEFIDIVIYHGYTMTSKLNLRDVLYTIKHYAFITSRYPLILSIEDNCSVPAQRKMASDIKEILGDMLLVQPISRDEWQLPSPEAMKNKIILKHKKLQLDNNDSLLSNQSIEEDQDQDLLSRGCTKRGVLYLRDNTKHLWTRHIFLMFADRLCYILQPVENDRSTDNSAVDDESGVVSWQDSFDDSLLSVFGIRPEEMHITEEWFHGKVGRDVAKDRLIEHGDKGNGVFLVRESGTFIGDYTLSFLYGGIVNHCRIKTTMVSGNKKFYFFDTLKRDTLYELISYYTKHPIDTHSFRAYLLTPCPQPQPHLNEPWFCADAGKQRAEELLNTVKEDGAFLIRCSSSDHSVFVLSLRVGGELWHYRLKRDGRIFVVNQMVFENLNQIVDFYSDRDFVRGICLKYPINERTIDQYARNDVAGATPGCYIELKDLDKEGNSAVQVEVLSIKPFTGANSDHLSFPAGVRITIVIKDADLWKGRYNGRVGWFPADYVQEINANGSGDGVETSMSYETIELAGSVFERYESDRPFSFRITQASSPWNVQEYIVAAEAKEEMEEWLNTMHVATRTVNDKINLLRTREKQLRIANELSSLVVYCQAVPFNVDFALQNPRTSFYEMCSFSESKHEKFVEKGLVLFNSRQLSRVYPQASRLTSTNFNPVPMWNSGCHMVALNYQTGDRPMQLNHGKFTANGRCGYVLKPQYMMEDTFRPDMLPSTSLYTSDNALKPAGMTCPRGNFPISITLQVITGRHLSRKDNTKGICSPFVEVEVTGLACDGAVERTTTITSNGLNPIWNETFVFNIFRPEVALIRFLIEDGDFVGPKTDPFIGQAVFPVDCIRAGFRSVPLLNQFNEPLELSALLIHVSMRSISDSPLRNPHHLLQAGRLNTGVKWKSPHLSGCGSVVATTSAGSVHTNDASSDPKTASSAIDESVLSSTSLPASISDTIRNQSRVGLVGNDDRQMSKMASVESNDDSIAMTVSSTTSSSTKKTLRKIFKFGKNL